MTNDPKKQENEGQNPMEMKKKLNEKQKEIADLKAKNKKLADDLAEEQAKVNEENPNSLILTNLLKTRTAELKRLEKEKENNATAVVNEENPTTIKTLEGGNKDEFIVTRHSQFQRPINIINNYGETESRTDRAEIEERFG